MVVSGCFLVAIGGLEWYLAGLGCFGVVWGVSKDPITSY